MTEKTRVRLGAYFLFALLVLTLPVTLAVTHYDAVGKSVRWVRGDDSLELVNVNSTESGIQHLMQQNGISRRAAEKIAYKTLRETNTRLIDSGKLPYNAQVDYYEVDGRTQPETASYKGSAVVLDAKAPAVAAAAAYWETNPRLKKYPEALEEMRRQMKKGYLLAPLSWFGGVTSTAPKAVKDLALAKLGATQNVRIAVICTVLPGFRDISPRSDGNTNDDDTGTLSVDYSTGAPSATPAEVVYRQEPNTTPAQTAGLKYNYADRQHTPPGRDERYGPGFGSIFDSPGGVFSTSGTWGVPRGVPAAWDYTQNAMTPHSTHATNLMLQNDMYNLFFSPIYSQASVANWFYQQTRGEYSIQGTANDINGWLRSAHVTNRYPYQIGGGNEHFVFPGTPVIRSGLGTLKPVADAGFNPAANQIVRATLSERGLTILFSKPVNDFSISRLSLNVYTNSPVTSGDNGTETAVPTTWTTRTGGWVTIDFDISGENPTQDPYDARRWTVTPTGSGFRYEYYTGALTSAATPAAWVPITGGGWNVAYDNYTDTSGTVLTAPRIDLPTRVNEPWGTPTAPAPPPPYHTFPSTTYVDVAQPQSTVHGGQRQGCPDLTNTLIEDDDLRVALYDNSGPSLPMDGRPFARLKSMDYYTRSYPGTGTRQIAHLTNEWGYYDDISGTRVRVSTDAVTGTAVSNPGYFSAAEVTTNAPSSVGYAPRPYPYDTGPNDTPNGGLWPTAAARNFGGREADWKKYTADVDDVLLDNGITLLGYQQKVYIAANNETSEPGDPEHTGGTVAGFQPLAEPGVVNLNEGSTGVIFHEMSHSLLNAVDLYDHDLYANGQIQPRPNPPFPECRAMGTHSIMDRGGRLDAWHLAEELKNNDGGPMAPATAILRDTLGVQIPHIENLLRDPVILKLPANPYYIKMGTPPADWEEYFLVENRNINEDDDVGAYGFDEGAKGLYIYHIDKRGPARNNPNQNAVAIPPTQTWKWWQRENDLLGVIIEQADGYYNLEFSAKNAGPASGGTWDTANLRVPFGANTDTRVNRFWQYPLRDTEKYDNAPLAVQHVSGAGSPTSYSHGYTYKEKDGGTNVIIPGTETDSFTRIVKISNIGDNMTADCYVEPAELKPLLTNISASNISGASASIASISRSGGLVTVTTTADHGFNSGEPVMISGVSDTTLNGVFRIKLIPAQPTQFTYADPGGDVSLLAGGTAQSGRVQQGMRDVGFLKLQLHNPDGGAAANLGRYDMMSIKDIYLDAMRILNSGSGTTATDVERVKLYLDGGDGLFDPATDTLLASAVPEAVDDTTTPDDERKWAFFGKSSPMGHRIDKGGTATIFVAYDIAPEAQINPKITVGVEFPDASKIQPRLPGTVQVRARNNAPYDFGTANFPIYSRTAVIVGFPDRLVVASDTSGLPAQASQSQAQLPMLKLNCTVNPNGNTRSGGSVRINSLRVEQTGTADSAADLVNCMLYADNGDGSFDYTADALLSTSSFTGDIASFLNLNLTLSPSSPVTLWLAVAIAPDADTGTNVQLSLAAADIELINNPTEDEANKDYVDTSGTWPIESLAVDIITPNNPPKTPIAPFAPSGGQQISDQTPTRRRP